MLKRLVFAMIASLIAFLSMMPKAYAFFDDTNRFVLVNISIGQWDLPITLDDLDNEMIDSFLESFGLTTLSDLYNDPNFQDTMGEASCTSTGCPTGGNYSIEGVNINGVLFDIQGISVVQSGRRSLGFLRVVDRSLNGSTPLYPLMPQVATSETDNYFNVYDTENSQTNNQYSIRLDNEIIITTSNPITNLQSVSFYALRGLRLNNDDILTNRTITVSISSDNTNWTAIGQASIQAPAGNDIYNNQERTLAFPFYQYNLTQNQLNNQPASGYYVRISYNGGSEGSGKNVARSRVIIDELTFN
ncbi:MAG: hypothetical protein ACOCUE_04185 [Candidatus Izemoplasmataceae bacterium]